MNQLFKYSTTFFILLTFLVYTTGIVLKYSECVLTHEVEVSVLGLVIDDSCPSASNKVESCCRSELKNAIACPSYLVNKCCEQEVHYFKDDVEYLATNIVKVEKPIAPYIFDISFKIDEKIENLNYENLNEQIDVPICLSNILIFYNHHNKVFPADAHIFTS